MLDLRDCSEHALVDSKQEVRDFGTPNARLSENISEANVLKIPNVRASSMREGERVAPEEPLERYHSDRHQGKPDQRECRFAPSETRVEEAYTGNHKEDEGGGSHYPSNITTLVTSQCAAANFPSLPLTYLIIYVQVL